MSDIPKAKTSPGPFEALDLAQLQFVRCLVRFRLTVDEAGAVIAGELDRSRKAADKMRRQMLRRSQLQPVEVRQ